MAAVLLAFANDWGDDKRHLRSLLEEGKAIGKALAGPARAGLDVLPPIQNATVDDVLGAFREHPDEIRIFHFGGHASASTLLFEDDAGKPSEAHARGLAGYLGEQRGLVLVFLNGCGTEPQVQRLRAAGIKAVVATTHAIQDEVAAAFAEAFYRELAVRPLRSAFDSAVLALQTRWGDDPRAVTREVIPQSEPHTPSWPWIIDCDPAYETWTLASELAGKPARRRLAFAALAAVLLLTVSLVSSSAARRIACRVPGVRSLCAPVATGHDAAPPEPAHGSPPEVPDADLVIAAFRAEHATRTFELARRLERELVARVQDAHIVGLRIATTELAPGQRDEAAKLLARSHAKLLIWGWYDDVGLQVSIEVPGSLGWVGSRVEAQELPLASADPSVIAFRVSKDIPEIATFLATFALGYLAYAQGHYGDGHALWDAAMAKRPTGIDFLDPAMGHFVTGRALQQDYAVSHKPEKAAEAICEYTAALQANKRMYEAYSNVGILLGEQFSMARYVREGNGPVRDKVMQCLEQAGLPDTPRALLLSAAELRPGDAAVEYNVLATMFQELNSDEELREQHVRERLKALHERDPTIPGVALMLGYFAVLDHDIDRAFASYQEATRLAPALGAAWMNLGLTQLARSDWSGALASLAQAHALPLRYRDAGTAVLVLATARQGSIAAVDALPKPDASPEKRVELSISALARAEARVRAGDTAGAGAQLTPALRAWEIDACASWPPGQHSDTRPGCGFETENKKPPPIPRGRRIRECIGDEEIALRLVDSIVRRQTDPYAQAQSRCTDPTPSADSYPWILDGIFRVARRELVAACPGVPLARWTTDACLGTTADARVGRVLDAIRHAAVAGILAQPVYFSGLACPHVYGFAAGAGGWQLEGAILRGFVGPHASAEQTLWLRDFDGRVSIREEEDETTYLDALWVEVVGEDGRRSIYRSSDPRLLASDGDLATLRPGDVLDLRFSGAPPAGEATLHAIGYYVPAHPRPGPSSSPSGGRGARRPGSTGEAD